ncbi:phosphate ABC transporter, phosphate-binding protein PstS [Campylobacter sputorum subsp. bubulus]|uniref:Phosphate-binding protein n=1 Tax=Campylobacter sputorum subsp. sputorum TaxID=32024 RepID=A0A381DJQ1_9BACT|nr:phosphate ABC transporter substrate-binding protein PstS [Campylobacter sputorum]ASM35914.1 phosphate ABC transporter, periplasmic phosphate-binding protein [Campylobacter sputorum aubsp. sputorum RM3237]ASM37598.1 phosphate ABC transporter, periplasmic phosphate-binding protein [Campylobacter sputorum bv. faecalis CCUG 20703]KAB0582351.1 phosphate ABC transporter substrate-binding protein PstS [Campylobacter sputorum subsp. sputorum]QEL06104.1 phosphate ABC transporter, periplasmic phosphat
MLKKLTGLVIASMVAVGSANAADKIMGQGATFPLPVYKDWAKGYYSDTKNQVTYSGGGSGKGVSAITDRNGDFGGTDSALKADELKEKKLLQFPTVIGSIVLAYNIDGVKDHALKLDGEAVAGIFSGKITKWNDPILTKLNPDLKLPDADIVPVVRSESSGTTFNFTSYISKANEDWAKNYGAQKTINWGAKVTPAQGNPLVAKTIKQTKNSIGYIEFAYKIKEDLNAATLKTRDGDWAEPTEENFAKAALNSNFSIDEHFYDVLAYGKGAKSYPIAAATFVLVPSDNQESAKKVTKFFSWAFESQKGKKMAKDLGYLPLPEDTVKMINEYWTKYGISPK